MTLAFLLALQCDLNVNWESFLHDEESRAGVVNFHEGEDAGTVLMFATWSYSELDDTDQAELLELPVELHRDVIGVLTPIQGDEFWACVNPELEPMDFLDVMLRRFGMTPAGP